MSRHGLGRSGSNARRYAQVDRDTPDSVAELTPEWLTAAMRAAEAIAPRHWVKSIVSDELDNGGHAMTGEVLRVTVTYDQPDAGPTAVIVKFASSDRAIKGVMEYSDVYAREILFYRDLASLMPLRVPDHLGSGLTPGRSKVRLGLAKFVDALPARVHRVLSAEGSKLLRATKRRYALLLEDCSPDTTVYDIVTPPPPELLIDALESLAELHARFWGGGREAAGHASMGPVCTLTPRLFRNEVRFRGLEAARTACADWWSNDDTTRVQEAADRLVDDVRILNGQMTLVHGDPRSGNLLYPTGGGSASPTFIDWGAAAVANPAWDVSYVLGSSLETSSSEAAGDLIAGYRRALSDRGVQVDEAELRAHIKAGWRAQTVLMVLVVRVMQAGSEYSEADVLYHHWLPRALALSRHA